MEEDSSLLMTGDLGDMGTGKAEVAPDGPSVGHAAAFLTEMPYDFLVGAFTRPNSSSEPAIEAIPEVPLEANSRVDEVIVDYGDSEDDRP